MKYKVLIIEDDLNILSLEEDYLKANSFDVITCTNGDDGLDIALKEDISLMLVDLMIPGKDGFEVCRKLREKKDIPILIVSARKDDADKIRGLGFGADDYITKPFSPSELVARVIAHISRYQRLKSSGAKEEAAKAESSAEKAKEVIEIDNLRLERSSRRAFVSGKEIILTNKEFDLLLYLAENPNTVFSKEELFEKVWKYDPIGETSTITVHINRLRDKIKDADPKTDVIHTVWGKGYRFYK